MANTYPSSHYFTDSLVCDVICVVAADNQVTVFFPPFIADNYIAQALVHFDDLNMKALRTTPDFWATLSTRVEENGSAYHTYIV